MTTDLFILKKEIDWSTLHLGINIPVSLQNVFYENMKFHLNKGDRKKIKLLIEGLEYHVLITNILFNDKKYPNHKDLLQIRYNPNSIIAKKLREIFNNSYQYLLAEKEKLTNQKKQLVVPKDRQEYLAIYSTVFDDVFVVDCITLNEITETKEEVRCFSEIELEQIISMQDNNSTIIKREKMIKIRKLDKTIGENLKKIYEYKCQICGQFIGEIYNATVINTHHIEHFCTSLNNNPENILVVCPNHHGIIHATNPIFERTEKTFTYPNGYVEGLKLNFHL